MRALQVLGLGEDGERLVCEDPSTGERFTLAADERLRAAARGDITRLGQLEIELESQLRPKDIQRRIRAGATVEQVAAAAGTSVARIEGFAYPVLQERSSIAERAQHAYPLTAGSPGRRRIGEIVADTLTDRGQGSAVSWDAFKDEGGWALQLRWKAGRSENTARWSYHPGPDGGTLTARDETAAELVDPSPRTLRPVQSATAVPARGAAADDRPTQEIPRVPATGPDSAAGPADRHGSATGPAAESEGEPAMVDDRSGVTPASTRQIQARTGTESARPGKRGSRPLMPSWEDVLLGSGAKRR